MRHKRVGCVLDAVRWRLMDGAKWVAACVLVSLGAQQASTSFGQIPVSAGTLEGD